MAVCAELLTDMCEQGNGEVQDPRDLARNADLHISVSAKIYHDDGTKTYETYPDVVAQILANASATAGA